jgi:hypothetical protein
MQKDTEALSVAKGSGFFTKAKEQSRLRHFPTKKGSGNFYY